MDIISTIIASGIHNLPREEERLVLYDLIVEIFNCNAASLQALTEDVRKLTANTKMLDHTTKLVGIMNDRLAEKTAKLVVGGLADKWIRSEYAMPVSGKVVFTYADGSMATGFVQWDIWRFSNYPNSILMPTPTHWMFLPELPTES